MNAQEAMKAVYEVIKEAKDMSAEGTDVMVSPKDFAGKLTSTELWRTINKMANDYDLFTLVLSPDAIKAHHYDNVYEPNRRNYESMNQYLVHCHDKFYEFSNIILNETAPIKELPEYLPYYIELMFKAIAALGITEENQPAKKIIEGWFHDNYPELSGNDVKALSTFVRHPSKKQGGWHANKKKDL